MANKQDLIAKVADATSLTKKDSAAAVDAVFAAVADYLAAGEKVQLKLAILRRRDFKI